MRCFLLYKCGAYRMQHLISICKNFENLFKFFTYCEMVNQDRKSSSDQARVNHHEWNRKKVSQITI